jgi:asparagine N-glycosylation enzyme membrane subunit Stt3
MTLLGCVLSVVGAIKVTILNWYLTKKGFKEPSVVVSSWGCVLIIYGAVFLEKGINRWIVLYFSGVFLSCLVAIIYHSLTKLTNYQLKDILIRKYGELSFFMATALLIWKIFNF